MNTRCGDDGAHCNGERIYRSAEGINHFGELVQTGLHNGNEVGYNVALTLECWQ